MVVELVGPAGAGKSTLARHVRQADATIHTGLSIWGLPRLRLIASGIALVPTMVMAALRNCRLRWPEIAHMIRLDTLRRLVRRMTREHGVILLDEGPVFAIGWLDLRFAHRRSQGPTAWRARALAAWAKLLDGVIFLDAADATLAQRIRTRPKRHRMRNSNDAAIRRFAGSFRRSFDRVVAELNRVGRLSVDVLKTDSRLEYSTARLMTALTRQRNGTRG